MVPDANPIVTDDLYEVRLTMVPVDDAVNDVETVVAEIAVGTPVLVAVAAAAVD